MLLLAGRMAAPPQRLSSSERWHPLSPCKDPLFCNGAGRKVQVSYPLRDGKGEERLLQFLKAVSPPVMRKTEKKAFNTGQQTPC